MPTKLGHKGQALAKKGILVQCVVALLLCMLVQVSYPQHTLPAVLGVLGFLLPHSIFAYWSFRYAGATNSKMVVQSFSQGLKLKLATTLILFVVAFAKFNAHPLPLLGAYATVMCSQWLAMFWYRD